MQKEGYIGTWNWLLMQTVINRTHHPDLKSIEFIIVSKMHHWKHLAEKKIPTLNIEIFLVIHPSCFKTKTSTLFSACKTGSTCTLHQDIKLFISFYQCCWELCAGENSNHHCGVVSDLLVSSSANSAGWFRDFKNASWQQHALKCWTKQFQSACLAYCLDSFFFQVCLVGKKYSCLKKLITDRQTDSIYLYLFTCSTQYRLYFCREHS